MTFVETLQTLELKKDELGDYYYLAMIQLVGGFRVSDVLGIQWRHIISPTDVLVIQGKGSNAKRVHVPQCSKFFNHIISSKRNPFSHISRFQVYRLYKRLGLTIQNGNGKNSSVTHSFRKLYVRDMEGHADNLEQIQQSIGHKSIKSTQYYEKK